MHSFAALLTAAMSFAYFASATGSEPRRGRILAEGATHSQPRSALRGHTFLAKNASPKSHVDRLPVVPEMPLPRTEKLWDMDASLRPFHEVDKSQFHEAIAAVNSLFEVVTKKQAEALEACTRQRDRDQCALAREELSSKVESWRARSQAVLDQANAMLHVIGAPVPEELKHIGDEVQKIADTFALCGRPMKSYSSSDEQTLGSSEFKGIPEVTFRTFTSKDLDIFHKQGHEQNLTKKLTEAQDGLCVALEDANTLRIRVILDSQLKNKDLSKMVEVWHERSQVVLDQANGMLKAIGTPVRQKLKHIGDDVQKIVDAFTLCGRPINSPSSSELQELGSRALERVPEVTFRTLTPKDLKDLNIFRNQDKWNLAKAQHELCIALEDANDHRIRAGFADKNSVSRLLETWFKKKVPNARDKANALLGAMDEAGKDAAPRDVVVKLADWKAKVQNVKDSLNFLPERSSTPTRS